MDLFLLGYFAAGLGNFALCGLGLGNGLFGRCDVRDIAVRSLLALLDLLGLVDWRQVRI